MDEEIHSTFLSVITFYTLSMLGLKLNHFSEKVVLEKENLMLLQ